MDYRFSPTATATSIAPTTTSLVPGTTIYTTKDTVPLPLTIKTNVEIVESTGTFVC